MVYCPKCSRPQAAGETQFCVSCGAPLGDAREKLTGDARAAVVRRGAGEDGLSPRQKGYRRGAALMLLSVVLIPAYVLLAALFPAEDRLVESAVSDTPFEKISQAVLFTLFMAGLARVVYARLFERGVIQAEGESAGEAGAAGLGGAASRRGLPPAQGIPVSGFGAWRADTGELARPLGAREDATKSK